MKIRNILLSSIEARRYIERNERPKQIRIDHNSNVTQIHDVVENTATIDFQYTASYGAVGVIKLQGSLIFEDENAKRLQVNGKNLEKCLIKMQVRYIQR